MLKYMRLIKELDAIRYEHDPRRYTHGMSAVFCDSCKERIADGLLSAH
jgi:hypothetical protein